MISARPARHPADALLVEARGPSRRPPALIRPAAAAAPSRALPEVLSRFFDMPPHVRQHDHQRYAFGLALLRAGAPAMALAEWEQISSASRASLKSTLAGLYSHVVASLVKAGKPEEAAQYGVLAHLRGHALPLDVARKLAAALVRAGLFVSARWFVGLLGSANDGFDRLLDAMTVPVAGRLTERLAPLVRDASLPASARAALARCTAAGFALDGRFAEGASLLSSQPPGHPVTGALHALLRFAASGGRERPSGADCDWTALASMTRDAPALHSKLVARPARCSHEARASYFIGRACHSEASASLRAALAAAPWSPDVARNFAALASVRATRALPDIDIDAWRDLLCVIACYLENPCWSAEWVTRRREAYGTDEDDKRLAEDFRSDLSEMISRRLADAAGAASKSASGAASVAALRAELAKERRAAAAMWKVGKVLSPDGQRLAFGPLFAERAGLAGMLQSYFAGNPEPQGPSASDELRQLMRATGRDEAAIRRMLSADEDRPEAELRRWFSELGEALALQAAGDPAAGREAALRVYVAHAPPTAGDAERFRAGNPGYAMFPDGEARLRADAGATVCDMSIAIFRAELSRADLDTARVPGQIRALLGEGSAFHQRDEVCLALTRLILEKRQRLLDAKNIESAKIACDLMKAAVGRLSGLEKPGGEAFLRLGGLYADQETYKDAVQAYEEAWRIWRDPNVAMNLVCGRLEHVERLRRDGRDADADGSLQRAREVARDARVAFPRESTSRVLEDAVQGVAAGKPVSSFFKWNRPEPPRSHVPPPLSEAATSALAALERATRGGDFALAWREAQAAMAASPRHPDVVASAVGAALRLATSSAPDAGALAFREVEPEVAAVEAAYPEHPKARSAVCVLSRHRVLFCATDEVGRLHAKAVRAWMAGDLDATIDALKVVFALSQRVDPEVCALLAEALVVRARTLDDPRGDLATAERILAVGREKAPKHAGMDRVREGLREIRSPRSGRAEGSR